MKLEQPLNKFMDELPIPKKMKHKYKTKAGKYYEVNMTQTKQKLHQDLPETTIWGYEGQFPGPTIEVNRGEHASVKWINNLPKKHLFEINHTYHGAEEDKPDVRTVVHLHGGATPPNSDGYPESWYTNDFKEVGPTFENEVYQYPNDQQGTTLWYHDHAMGITRLNVYAGLAGMYLIHDKIEDKLNIPKGEYDIPLVITDRSFNEDGSLFYEQFGDHILVNGKVWPYFNVEPRKYRFRILNASNSRTYVMRFDNNMNFYQIASDGGLLEKPALLSELQLAPSERAELIIDFSKLKNQDIILKNFATFPELDPETTANIMMFKINKNLRKKDTTEIPKSIEKITKYTDNDVKVKRQLTLNQIVDEIGQVMMLLNNQRWMDEIKVKPVTGEVEEWELINTMPIPHPIHIHLIQFQVVGRKTFDVAHYNETKEIKYTSDLILPKENERGLKDTILVNGGEVTIVRMDFKPFTGRYVWHCHLLEHEDHEMMLPFDVLPNKEK